MHHWELRLDRMLFAGYPRAERRLYWLSDDGSYHFGAARYQVYHLGVAVPLTGRFCRYGVNVPMISVICQQWHLFVVPIDEPFGSFFDTMNAFEYPSGNSDLPHHMHGTDESGITLELAWLGRGHPRVSVIVSILSVAGFPDFRKQLQQLAKEPPPC